MHRHVRIKHSFRVHAAETLPNLADVIFLLIAFQIITTFDY
jgi:hypothetical protein